VSHSHYDHYSKKIFGWAAFGDITYIFDAGCKVPENAGAKITKVKEGEDFDVFEGGVKIKTYGSTDIGVSFLVAAGGFTVFHSGDLNDWYWEDESTPEELRSDEAAYIEIIKKLAGQKIDAAFIPEDPRLGKNAGRGIRHFKEIVNPKKIIPMHF
jgi:L-ascorbate metabolism protein UlaG (beta-lactamase superfamily)